MAQRDGASEVIFEQGGLGRVGELLRAHGSRRVLVVTSPSRRFLPRALAALDGLEHAVFDGARTHVPVEVLEAAEAAARALGADAVLTLGGGSTTGVGKLLKLHTVERFIAVPTTYSGSERTSIWGTTEAGDKRTGRDEGVRPDVIVYDAQLLSELPVLLAVQSAANALAHPLSALSTGKLEADARERALAVARALLLAIEALAATPRDVDARESALVAASGAARVLDGATLGTHHKLAHLLGGRFGLDHAALHSLLLPHTLAALLADRELGPLVTKALAVGEGGVAEIAADERLRRALQQVGAPLTLKALGVDPQAARSALAAQPALAHARTQLEAVLK